MTSKFGKIFAKYGGNARSLVPPGRHWICLYNHYIKALQRLKASENCALSPELGWEMCTCK